MSCVKFELKFKSVTYVPIVFIFIKEAVDDFLRAAFHVIFKVETTQKLTHFPLQFHCTFGNLAKLIFTYHTVNLRKRSTVQRTLIYNFFV